MADEAEKSGGKVRVRCGVPGGLHLQLFEKGQDDGTGSGYRPMQRVPGGVTIAGPVGIAAGAGDPMAGASFGETEIDAEFWSAWAEQNKLNPILQQGLVAEVKGKREGEG